jgi:hypothetical protein
VKFENTGLWQCAFDSGKRASHSPERQRLAESYRRFWGRATTLAGQIAHALPNLTLHDEQHFEALWQRADLIAGQGHSLNPMETFVFGGAILLHDAGHAVNAYPGGLSGIEKTPQWQDNLVTILRGENGEPPSEELLANPSPESRQKALFETLRTLHAEHAKILADMLFTNETTNETSFLIEDAELRTHLGETIGLVAASHHWSIDELELKLRRRVGVPANFPQGWAVDPIKLACLLRCADAVQIDQERAPDFSYALLRLKGLSESHWRGQNRLAVPTVDPRATEALLFTSTRSFGPGDADAWWIACDAIAMANRELVASARLLRDLGIKPFAITRVQDAEAPGRLARHVQVSGWRPVAAEIKIARIDHVVAILGGEHLYGRDLAVPLRELIQNADDAIRARREMEKENSDFVGRITIRLELKNDGNRQDFWLHVEDNGIGMSERRLTGPLLEFGTSYWTSDLLRSEFPGLSAQRLRQTGRFGIGFFSVVMASDRIIVASRDYREGQAAVRSLSFRKGLKLRPLLLNGASPSLPTDISTRVSLFLPPDRLQSLFAVQYLPNERRVITLAQLVGHLCPSLDCDVRVIAPNQNTIIIHHRDWYLRDKEEWLRRIILADCIKDENLMSYLQKVVPLLRPVMNKGRRCGMAAIAPWPISAGINAIGGLISGHHSRQPLSFSREFIGLIECEAEGPRRHGGRPVADDGEIATWASEQATLLQMGPFEDSELYYASAMISELGGDPTPIARCSINRRLTTIDDVFTRLREGAEIVAPVEAQHNGLYLSVASLRRNPFDRIGLSTTELEFTCCLLEMLHVRGQIGEAFAYRVNPTDKNGFPNSFLGCLIRYCKGKGDILIIDPPSDLSLGRYLGAASERDGFATGMDVRAHAIRLSLAK